MSNSAENVTLSRVVNERIIPVQTRSERNKSVNPDDFEKVSVAQPQWKYTPLAMLAGFDESANYVSETVAYEVAENTNITASWVLAEQVKRGVAGLPEDKIAAAAWQAAKNVYEVVLDGVAAHPITIKNNLKQDALHAAHTIIRAKKNSSTVLLWLNTGKSKLVENVEIILEENAKLSFVSLQEWDESSIHLAEHHATLAKNATLEHIAVTLGSGFVRLNPSIHLDGQNAAGHAWGAYMVGEKMHVEHQVYIDHNAANTLSRVTYKGALCSESARSVWIGDVLIRNSGVGTDSYEQNRNLILVDGARADSVPNLEIETGDIAGAGHASATGRFDDEQLFYLRSRGIPEEQARRLVVRGFLREVIVNIPDESIQEHIQNNLDQALDDLATKAR